MIEITLTEVVAQGDVSLFWNNVVTNEGNECEIELCGRQYVVPANSTFLMVTNRTIASLS